MLRSLNLFGQKWKIVWHKVVPYLDHQFRGMTCYEPREIHLLKNTDTERSTMLHELIHVASDTCGADMTEAQVVALERGLWMIFEANPKLMEYFVYGNQQSNTRLVAELLQAATNADPE